MCHDDCEVTRDDWINKISKVTKPHTPWVSQNRLQTNSQPWTMDGILDIRYFTTPKTHTLYSYRCRSVTSQGFDFVGGFILDNPSCLDSKQTWFTTVVQLYVHTCSFLTKYILVYVVCLVHSKCLQSITTFHSDLHVISLDPGIFNHNSRSKML